MLVKSWLNSQTTWRGAWITTACLDCKGGNSMCCSFLRERCHERMRWWRRSYRGSFVLCSDWTNNHVFECSFITMIGHSSRFVKYGGWDAISPTIGATCLWHIQKARVGIASRSFFWRLIVKRSPPAASPSARARSDSLERGSHRIGKNSCRNRQKLWLLTQGLIATKDSQIDGAHKYFNALQLDSQLFAENTQTSDSRTGQ